jgi:hypothetical protein
MFSSQTPSTQYTITGEFFGQRLLNEPNKKKERKNFWLFKPRRRHKKLRASETGTIRCCRKTKFGKMCTARSGNKKSKKIQLSQEILTTSKGWRKLDCK